MFLKRLGPGQVLVLGFAIVIFVGALLLMLPISAQPGVRIHPVDALFTSTSAVCVTGLVAIDTAEYFSVFGRTVVALLIQTGGLGITCISVAFILLAGKKIGLRDRVMVREALNLESLKGVVKLVKSVVLMTLCFELTGMALSYIVFSQNYPPLTALGISAFHAVSAFNNCGFDILGGYTNLIPYRDNVLLNLTTCGLIIFGGLGFYVIREMVQKRSFAKLSMSSKIVLIMTGSLLVIGTLLLKLTEKDISWLTAFFHSTSARTAGFSTTNLGGFTQAGQFILIILMFIGASPGSTGGGIKTTTFFTILKSIFSVATNRDCTAFRRKIPGDSILKAYMILALGLMIVCVNTVVIALIEPQFSLAQVLFETVSAFGTVGLSTGITPDLRDASKLLLSLTMFFGRLGPLTIACVWSYHPTPHLRFVEERVSIG